MNLRKIGTLCALFCAAFTAQASQPTALVAWGSEYIPPLPADTKFKAIATSYFHNLAIRSDDTVVAWGADHDGQCRVPAGLSDVVAVAAGNGYSLALKRDGTVVGWGFDATGAINTLASLTNVVAIAAGRSHSLALKADGTVVSSWTPVPVPEGLSNVVAIAAGQYKSLALKADGTVFVWGNGITPSTIASNIVAITHSLGLKEDGSVVVFSGPLPWVPPIRLNNVVAIASSIDEAGTYRQHATLTADGVVSTWLLQPNGELDSGGQYEVSEGTSDIAVGPHHSLGLRADGSLFAFGRNDYSQSVVPTDFNDVIAVAAGKSHQLIARKDGTIFAWGGNEAGQLYIPYGITNAVAVAAGAKHNAVLKADGGVAILDGWGRITAEQSFIMANVTNAVAIAAGDDHGLVLDSNGKIWTWGTNSFGQRDVPLGLSNVVAIAAGEAHSVALRADGTAIAWGKISQDFTNYNDIVAVEASMLLRANGTTVLFGRAENHFMPPVSNAVAISSGVRHEIALTKDRKVIMGGFDHTGHANTYIAPEVKHVLAIEAGWGKSFAIVSIAPELRSQLAGGNLVLSWPVSTKTYTLQSTADVTINDSWTEVTGDVLVENHRNTFTLPVSGEQRFFRLVSAED